MKVKKLLLVDDSSTARMLVMNFLQIAGIENIDFIEAEDGSKALEILSKRSIDIIITDIIMPKMDGRVFIQKLRLKKEYLHTPIVVLTSLSEGSSPDLLNQPNLTVLQKPITPEKLLEALEGIL